jgi:peroxiredoxin
MMTKRKLWLLFLFAVLGRGVAPAVLIGEPAPPLVIKEWLQGAPVALTPGTNIYVLEIWRSTSATCRMCVTNLDGIQSRFKSNGVVVVGISDEPPEAIRQFLQNQVTNVEYEIAADDTHQTARAYMVATDQKAVPYSFVVGTNATVLWHGSPFNGLTRALELITTGQYDVGKAAKMEVASHQMRQYLTVARRGDLRAKMAGETMLANRANDAALLCDMAYMIATVPQLPKRDFALANRALDQAEQLNPTNKASVMGVRAVCLFSSGRYDAGLTLATQALASAQSPQSQADIEILLHSMQGQLARAKARRPQTNQVDVAEMPAPFANAETNQVTPEPGKDAAAKP